MQPAVTAAIITATAVTLVGILQAWLKLREARSGRSGDQRSFFAAPPLPTNYVERTVELSAIRKLVIQNTEAKQIAVTGVRGMGGIGKTVLAQALCRDEAVQRVFEDGVFWVTLGENLTDEALIAQIRELMRSMGEPVDGLDSLNACSARLRRALRRRAVLIVLDDAWNSRHIQPFLLDCERCRLLFTTRNASIVASIGAQEYPVDVLSREQSLQLLQYYSRRPISMGGFPTEAVEVVYECGHLALALAVVGSLMRGKQDDHWGNVLSKLCSYNLGELQQQFPNYEHPNVLRALQVSVDELDETSRCLYIDLAVLPEDAAIPEKALQVLWNLDRYAVQDAVDLFEARSLARRETDGSVLLHDLQLMLVKNAARYNLLRRHERFLESYKSRCTDGWATGPDDGYFFERLPHHLLSADRCQDLHELLLDIGWLKAKIIPDESFRPGVGLQLFPGRPRSEAGARGDSAEHPVRWSSVRPPAQPAHGETTRCGIARRPGFPQALSKQVSEAMASSSRRNADAARWAGPGSASRARERTHSRQTKR